MTNTIPIITSNTGPIGAGIDSAINAPIIHVLAPCHFSQLKNPPVFVGFVEPYFFELAVIFFKIVVVVPAFKIAYFSVVV